MLELTDSLDVIIARQIDKPSMEQVLAGRSAVLALMSGLGKTVHIATGRSGSGQFASRGMRVADIGANASQAGLRGWLLAALQDVMPFSTAAGSVAAGMAPCTFSVGHWWQRR